jgi:hypothetical protein
MSLTVDLSPEQEATLQARALAQGVSAEQYVRGVLERDLKPFESAGQRGGRHISEIIAEITAEVPAEEFGKLPGDGSREHDHYLYGHPERNG